MKYALFATGCQQNIYDSERIAHLLEKMGYVLAPEEEAHLIVVLSCSVRQKPIDRIWGKLKNWHNLNPQPKIIVTGCLLPRDKIKMDPKIDAFIPTDKIEKKLSKFLFENLKFENSMSDDSVRARSIRTPSEKIENLKLKILAKSSAFVPIMYGCDNFCSYCAVPYTRGRERSRPEDEIIDEVKNLIKKGVKEITLLGQNVNSYKLKAQMSNVKTKTKNLEAKSDFVKLLEQIEEIKGLEKISFLTCHPKDVGNDLIEWMTKSKKFSGELHLPLQSGDNEILHRMNRGYSVRYYLGLIESLKSKIKCLKLSTDLIVGFPDETRQQFNNTVNLCQKIGFDGAYVSQYSPRPGTPAAKMNDNVSPQEKKRRWSVLNKLINKKP